MPRKTVKKPLGIIKTKSREPCHVKGCKTITAYMKRDRPSGEIRHWCAKHFDEKVVQPRKEAYKDTSKLRYNGGALGKPKRRIKGRALKPAVDAALASPKRRRVKVKK